MAHEAPNSAWDEVYDELRAVARAALNRERPDHTLQPTAIVNEVYLRMADQDGRPWNCREQFFAIAARMIRRVLVDHARGHDALKRGGHVRRVLVEDSIAVHVTKGPDVLPLDAALHKLAELSQRQADIVELRFFAGLTGPQIAAALGISERTVKNDWRFARAWLHRELEQAATS